MSMRRTHLGTPPPQRRSRGWPALLLGATLLAPCLCPAPAQGGDTGAPCLKEAGSHWAVLTGYGGTHVGMGATRVHVQTVDLIARYGRFLTSPFGESWYRARHHLLIELPVHYVVDPDVAPIVGLNFLACWTFVAFDTVLPYIFVGGGPVYTEADIPGMGSTLNGNYQAGLGLCIKSGRPFYLNVEYRLHHISNLNTRDPNDPLNSSKVLVGLTRPF